ncbi:MAG: Gfo/Idh/MocA family oxidoreductase [Epulopiscium sp.]|nr:Gfo/Idh/MocA family oxidoreductase [Candidatus Epulonipiscium sp.]
MGEEKIRFGIIGCGIISKAHASALAESKGGILYSVCDIIEEKAKELAEQYNVEKVYTDYNEMLQDPNVDVVCICTPSGLHGEMCIAAAKAGKHIVCEKPMEITEEKNEAILEAIRKYPVKMQCIFQRRTMNAAIETRKLIQEGRLGKIVLACAYLKYYRDQAYYDSAGWRGTWELDGGGALMNQGVHGVDLLAWMVGEKITSVFARAGTLARDIDVEDTSVALLQWEGGGYGVIEGTTTVYPGLDTRFEIHGEKGTIIFGDQGVEMWKFLDEEPPLPAEGESLGGASDPKAISSIGHYILIEDLIDAIKEDREPMIPPEEGKVAVALIRGIYRSAKENKEVYF